MYCMVSGVVIFAVARLSMDLCLVDKDDIFGLIMFSFANEGSVIICFWRISKPWRGAFGGNGGGGGGRG